MSVLEKLYAARLTARFRALDEITVPEYKGSTFRGALGHAFRRVSCPIICRDNRTCLLRFRCAYSVCFETPVPENAAIMRKYPFAPHPFVLEPPSDDKTRYEPGEEFDLGLILIGRGNDYVAHFIYAFDELGGRGLGRGRGRAELVSLSTERDGAAAVLYNKSEDRIIGQAPLVSTDQIQAAGAPWEGKPLRIVFETPMRIKFNGAFTKEPHLSHLVPSLLRRLHSLEYFHCGGEEDWDPPRRVGLIEAARRVPTRLYRTTWQDIERYSKRQDAHMQMGGFVGVAEYDPVPVALLPFLKWGELLHLGKASAFGLGKYTIQAVA